MPLSQDEISLRSDSNLPLSQGILLSLLQKFGRAPRVVDFFNMYSDLRRVFLGLPVEDTQFYQRMIRSLDQIDSRLDYDSSRNLIAESSSELIPLLRRVESSLLTDTPLPDQVWRRVIQNYADMIQTLGSDKGIFMRTRRLPGTQSVRWLRLQRATPKEEYSENLRVEDPDLYRRIQMSDRQSKLIDLRIKERIVADGLSPQTKMFAGRLMNIGVGKTGDISVYDIDGTVLLPEEFMKKIRDKAKEQQALRRVNPTNKMWLPEEISGLRSISPDRVNLEPSETRWVSLTDDPDKDVALTRVYAVKNVDGEDIVASGRFSGIKMADLVNVAGRQIEGSIYSYSFKTQRIDRREAKRPDGSVETRRTAEPYATLDGGRLLLRLPGAHQYTQIRRNMRELSNEIPTIDYEPTSRSEVYHFDAKDFRAVRDALGGVALSSSAAKFLQIYFEDLSRAEQASNAKNLSRYSSESLGFKFPIRTHIQKALAWLDANGNRGICALDTGMGKTATSIASMQNLRKKGLSDTGNGRFLYVCTQDLIGNLPKEIYKFLPRVEAEELLGRVDVITYHKFLRLRKKDPSFGDSYVAIYFDEAHLRFKKKESSYYQTATECKCPRKILLSASPMVNSPMEVFTMASVANGLNLNSPEGRREEKQFRDRFSETVGGRIVGIRREANTARDFRVWVKRNLFFADKRDATGEGSVNELRREVEAISMPPIIEEVYRETMGEMVAALREVRDSQFSGRLELAVEASKYRLRDLLKKLTLLSNTPSEVIPGAPNPKIDRAEELVANHLGTRTLLFTDSPKMALQTWRKMAEKFPGKSHAVGLGDNISVITPRGEEIKYTEREYVDAETGRKVKREEWKTHVLSKIIQTDPTVATTVLTAGYAVGQNLQFYGVVIHLDRDNWSNETMKQRTARAWRSGNKDPVDEYTLDLVYSDSAMGAGDSKTLDQIRALIQEIDAELFTEVVSKSQVEQLGAEWIEIEKQRSLYHEVSKRMIERSLSPYARNLGEMEAEESDLGGTLA